MRPPRRSVACSRPSGPALAALLLVALAATSAWAGPTAKAEPVTKGKSVTKQTLASLLAAFRASPGFSADFREEKRMALLAAPLVSRGAIYFRRRAKGARALRRRGALARHVLSPSRSITVLDASAVRIFDGKRWSSLDLSKRPTVRAFVDAFSTILAGDEAALSALYRITFTAADKGAWSATLVPKAPLLSKVVARLVLSGRGLVLSSLSVHEAGGDSTTMTFTSVRPRRRFSAAEALRLFPRP